MSNSKTWTNWAGTAECHPRAYHSPNSEKELQAIVKEALKTDKTIRVSGSGHSFTKLVETNSILISLENWRGIMEIDGSYAKVRSGTQLKFLGERLYEEGLAQENLGDIDVQSVAGAFSTGTHGTGVEFGTLSTQLTEITFINGKGELITCSETQEPEIFKAAQISLGALGIITRMTLKCVPKYILELKNIKGDFNECLSKLEEYNQENRNFEFYYFPYTETVQMKISNITQGEPKKGGVLKYLNDIVLENGAFKLVSEISRIFPSQSKKMSQLVGALVGESQRKTWSHEVFATTRLVRFTEMEYNIPKEHFETCIREIKQKIEKEQYELHFPIECRFVKADDIFLSPAYQRESAYIAIHMYKGMPYKKYFQDMEEIFKKYQGRPHWGKLHNRTPKELQVLYPQWHKFHSIRKRMDPNGVFMNDYLKKVLGDV